MSGVECSPHSEEFSSVLDTVQKKKQSMKERESERKTKRGREKRKERERRNRRRRERGREKKEGRKKVKMRKKGMRDDVKWGYFPVNVMKKQTTTI